MDVELEYEGHQRALPDRTGKHSLMLNLTGGAEPLPLRHQQPDNHQGHTLNRALDQIKQTQNSQARKRYIDLDLTSTDQKNSRTLFRRSRSSSSLPIFDRYPEAEKWPYQRLPSPVLSHNKTNFDSLQPLGKARVDTDRHYVKRKDPQPDNRLACAYAGSFSDEEKYPNRQKKLSPGSVQKSNGRRHSFSFIRGPSDIDPTAKQRVLLNQLELQQQTELRKLRSMIQGRSPDSVTPNRQASSPVTLVDGKKRNRDLVSPCSSSSSMPSGANSAGSSTLSSPRESSVVSQRSTSTTSSTQTDSRGTAAWIRGKKKRITSLPLSLLQTAWARTPNCSTTPSHPLSLPPLSTLPNLTSTTPHRPLPLPKDIDNETRSFPFPFLSQQEEAARYTSSLNKNKDMDMETSDADREKDKQLSELRRKKKERRPFSVSSLLNSTEKLPFSFGSSATALPTPNPTFTSTAISIPYASAASQFNSEPISTDKSMRDQSSKSKLGSLKDAEEENYDGSPVSSPPTSPHAMLSPRDFSALRLTPGSPNVSTFSMTDSPSPSSSSAVCGGCGSRFCTCSAKCLHPPIGSPPLPSLFSPSLREGHHLVSCSSPSSPPSSSTSSSAFFQSPIGSSNTSRKCASNANANSNANCEVNGYDGDEKDEDGSERLALKSVDKSIDITKSTASRESVFGKEMWLLQLLETGRFFIGREIATLLKRQTFNMYRSMKLRGINLLRSLPDHVEHFASLGIVKPGTHSVTLIPYKEGLGFIKECLLREIRLNKKKKKNKMSNTHRSPTTAASSPPASSPYAHFPAADLDSFQLSPK